MANGGREGFGTQEKVPSRNDVKFGSRPLRSWSRPGTSEGLYYSIITFFMDLSPVLVTISNRYIPLDRRLVFIPGPFSEYK